MRLFFLLAVERPLLQLDTSDPFLQEAIDKVNKHRQEQIALDNKLLEIMAKSKKRRDEFRAVWGFSPKSINRKQSLKTVLNVQTVKFSEDAPPPPIVDEGGEIPAEEVVEPLSSEEDHEGEKGSSEDVLNQSISTDLFIQMVDANLPLHNFSGINCGEGETTFSMDELASTLQADYKQQQDEQPMLQTPVVEEESPMDEFEFEGPDEILDEVDMELEDDEGILFVQVFFFSYRVFSYFEVTHGYIISTSLH